MEEGRPPSRAGRRPREWPSGGVRSALGRVVCRPGNHEIPERACFTTWSVTALSCTTREVTFYLAVASPSSSRLALPDLVASSSSVPARARSGSAAATPGSPDRGQEPPQDLHDQGPKTDRSPLPPASLSPVSSLARRRSRRGPVSGPPPPRLEVPIRSQEPPQDLHDQGPKIDRSPSSSRLALPGLVASSSSVSARARFGSAAATPGSPESVARNCRRICTPGGQRWIASPVVPR